MAMGMIKLWEKLTAYTEELKKAYARPLIAAPICSVVTTVRFVAEIMLSVSARVFATTTSCESFR
jgi:hypothetical protein